MGALMRRIDWSQRPAGPLEEWPRSLRTTVDTCIHSRTPMVIYWGADLLQFYNDAFRAILGDEHPDAMGRPAREHGPELWALIGPHLQRVLTGGEATYVEDQKLLVARGGLREESHLNLGFAPIHDERGAVAGVFCTVTETTSRVINERRLRTLRELAQALADTENEPDVWSRSKEALEKNRDDLPDLLLYRVDAANFARLASATGDLPAPAEIDLSLPTPFAPITDAAPDAVVLPIPSAGAREGFMVAGRNPHRPLDPDYRGFFSLVADRIAAGIARARIQEDRRRAASAIDLDRERTARLLLEAQRAARAREEMLAVVSHDLRNPLNAISIAASSLEWGSPGAEPDERITKRAATIRRAVARMDRLLSDLLDLASIDAGKLKLQTAPHAVEQVLLELREVFSGTADEKRIKLSVHTAPEVALLACDRDRLVQALSNLVSNALKFTREGGRIDVTATPSGEGIRFSVQDTGAGIPAAVLPHVFDRYWHAAQRSGAGHGLGLAIVKGIVEAHGGQVSVQSTPGEGSTFSFEIPFQTRAAPSAPDVVPLLDRDAELDQLFARGGSVGASMRAHDWSRTELGPVVAWPQALRIALGECLGARSPAFVFWGPSFIQLHNDAARPLAGGGRVLGAALDRAATPLFQAIRPELQRVLEGADVGAKEDELVTIERNGVREEAYFTFSFAPIRLETGTIAGVFVSAIDQSRKVRAERRMALLRELALRAADAGDELTVCRRAARVLDAHSRDVPFALIYARADDGTLQLAAQTGLADDDPRLVTGAWPIEEAIARKQSLWVIQGKHLGALPGGPWPEPARGALVVPLGSTANGAPAAVLVAGSSPRLPSDAEYRDFLEQLAAQLLLLLRAARAQRESTARDESRGQLERAKAAFFSSIVHQFRTPLALIASNIEDAIASRGHALTGEALDAVRRSTARMGKTINALLEFSRIEAGRAQSLFAPTDLAAVTVELANAFRATIERAGLSLIVDCAPLSEPVYVDSAAWEKIVLNLLSNALKYTHRGEIRIGLTQEQGHAVLTVQDTGVGIPEPETLRVFDRFYRVPGAHGRSHEGTGAGLAVVHELVRLHRGDVAVTSKLGQGSTFTVRIPRGFAHLPREQVVHAPRPRSGEGAAKAFIEEARHWLVRDPDRRASEAAPELATARVLLINDNAELREYLAELLRRAFGEVRAVADAGRALELARVGWPEIILSDLTMPGFDGLGLARALRADERTRAIPIILLTAPLEGGSGLAGLDQLADDYLTKPFSGQELIARVRTQLEMARIRSDVVRYRLAREHLQSLMETRDEFISVASHELRTPLAALQMQVQGLTRGPAGARLDPVVKRRLQAADRSVERIVELVNHLIEASNLAAGRLSLVPVRTSLGDVIDDAVQRLQPAIARSGSTVSVDVGANIIGFWDKQRVGQVVTHLLSNALKYGEGRPIEIHGDSAAGRARFSIRDSGVGIAQEELQRIFRRFERGAAPYHYGGFGLGLWMAEQIVVAMGGTLRVESEKGRGSLFTVDLPLHWAEAPLHESQVS